ncbi:FG-GAP-like repeat-containing protein [Streptomyces sp. NPDC056670]|uniref:FG-GAP-like repeat-containing protein n=1 Tax=Streptomyces sp. NPDC056670 TaxID=3345904 RepID=UPI003673BC67
MPSLSVRTAGTAGLLAAALAASLVKAAPAGAVAGAPAAGSAGKAVARLQIGDTQRACTGALVAPQWVLTAASCFTGGTKDRVSAGAPQQKTTVTVGRTDMTQPGGSVQEAVELVPRTDRDVVMVKLARRVQDPSVEPLRIASEPAAASEQLTALGFGRTKTEWVPDKLHSATFTVGSVAGSTVNLNGSREAVLCQGDAGGPAVRMNAGTPELVAINSASWQAGCLGADAAETRTGARDVRVDDLSGWIRQTAFRAQDDLTGDGVADLASVWYDGTLHLYPGDKAKGLAGTQTQLLGGTTWKTTKQLVKGDFTNDGIADLIAVWTDGTMHLYKGKGDGTIEPQRPVSQGGNTWGTLKQITAGDFDGDGVADLMTVWFDGSMHLYKGDGKGDFAAGTSITVGGNTWATVRLLPGGDFDGDGIADVMAVWNDGTMHFYRGKGDGQIAPQRPVAMGNNTWKTVLHMTAGDHDGDGVADIMAIWNDGSLHLYKGDGKGDLTDGITMWGGTTWKTALQLA